jgi:hypothetical protein
MRLSFIAGVLLASIAFAQAEQTPAPMAELERRVTYFYLDPSEAEFATIQEMLGGELAALQARGTGADFLMAVFLAKVHMQHDWPIGDLEWMSDVAREIATAGDSELARYVEDDSLVDPTKLDVWWVSFFATGDTKYLDNLLARVGDLDSESGTENLLIMGAANWSVTANCRQHEAVLEHANKVLESDPPRANHAFIHQVVLEAQKPLE